MASSSLMEREPTTRRGRRALEDRSSKLVENVKTAMFIKGPSTSQHMTDVMTEFVRELFHQQTCSYPIPVPLFQYLTPSYAVS